MLRAILGIVAGLVVWTVVATLGNLLMRYAWPGYAEVEAAMKFTTAIMLGRLLLGAVASLAAGFVAAWIVRRRSKAIPLLGLILLAAFIPAHYRLWGSFPAWYHVAFLLSLVVMTPLGALLYRRRDV